MWFDTWTTVGRTLLVGGAAYFTLVAVLRVTGKRTLSKLNAYDFVVTVALGSTLATILLDSNVAWTEGATALALLAGLQLVVAWTSSHAPAVRPALTAEPTLVLQDGRLLHDRMREQRLTESEVRQAVRATGAGDLSDVAAVVLESDGSLSVVGRARIGDGSALHGVRGMQTP